MTVGCGRSLARGLAVLLAAGGLLVSGSPAQAAYWNVFNIEGESSVSAAFVTYATLSDMLADTNRTGLFEPTGGGFGRNVVDSGSNGSTYWNLFNIEGESSVSAAFVTYATLSDMLADTNRTGLFEPTGGGFGRNVVDSGSDGSTYWNLFNIEGESAVSAAFVTYATLADMLADTNRTGLFEPDGGGFGRNVVGGGAEIPSPTEVAEPGILSLIGSGLLALAVQGRWRRRPPKQR